MRQWSKKVGSREVLSHFAFQGESKKRNSPLCATCNDLVKTEGKISQVMS